MTQTTQTRMGETWDMLSWRLYGDEHHIRELMDANPGLRAVLRFSAGTDVIVPAIIKKTASSLPPWKR